jgi:chorismate dehydratase
MQLKLGHIDYLNCVPLFHHLEHCGFNGTIVDGVPSVLNEMLAQGDIDVSPSSSFEYGRGYKDYLLLPDHSISACDSVKSVLLFSPVPIEQLAGQCIYLTGESATSVNLLRVLLREYYGWDQVVCEVPQVPIEQLLVEGKPVLLIGDRALKAAIAHRDSSVIQYDLAQLWRKHAQLPFVFALWIVRRESFVALAKELRELHQQLNQSRHRALNDLNALARVTDISWLTDAQLIDYWQSMSYQLSGRHIAGLEWFFHLCVKYKYLPEVPTIDFCDFD